MSNDFICAVPNGRFWLQGSGQKRCLKVQDYWIIGANCSSPTLDMLWIWPRGTENRKLMNVKTLQCLERSSKNNRKVYVTSCQRRYTNLQNMRCVGGNKLRWKNKVYLHLGTDNYAISKNSRQTWKSDKKSLCAPKISYTGTTLKYFLHFVACM